MIDSKNYIIDEAYKLFLNKSYEAVSISDISKAVGMTKGALYHHFLNKEELFRAVIDKYLVIDFLDEDAEYDSLAHYIDSAMENARKIVLNTFRDRTGFVPLNYLSLLIDAMRHYKGYEMGSQQFFSLQIEMIKKKVREAMERKEIRNDLDSEITAINLFSIILGLAPNIYTHRSVNLAMDILRRQLNEFYKLLKV